MTPLSLVGFNRDVVVENSAQGPPYTTAEELNPDEGNAFYQSGLSGKSVGLPVTGSFTSELDRETSFAFAPYIDKNALVLSSSTGLSQGTLTLVTPGTYKRIAILANSASGGSSPTLILNFHDGTRVTNSYNAPDWFYNNGFALSGVERIRLSTGATEGAPSNPRFYQTTIDLASLLGPTNRTLVSLTFQKAEAGSTGIYAVSGELQGETPPQFVLQPTNQFTLEAGVASFAAVAIGQPPPAYQWLRGGTAITGATQSSFALTNVVVNDNGAEFRAVAYNIIAGKTLSVTSSVAMLTVIADTNPPALLHARSAGLQTIQVYFSEAILNTSATNRANYSVIGPSGPISISQASIGSDPSKVLLTVAPLSENLAYTLVVNGIRDLSSRSNAIAPNSSVSFAAISYFQEDVGAAAILGSVKPAGNGLDVLAKGDRIGGTTDQFLFTYLPRTGDFDVRVRVENLSLTDAWATAGLMAREAGDSGSRFVAVLATPSISGCFLETRTVVSGASARMGSFPVNYPATWLRLRRIGNDLSGFASRDGSRWTPLGAVTVALPLTVQLGFAVSSRNPGEATSTAFRDYANVSSTTQGVPTSDREPLGQSSRRTPLVISEIMYHPAERMIGTNKAQLEFIELFNSRAEPEDLSGYQISGDVRYIFPPKTVLPGGGFLVLARSPGDMKAIYGLKEVHGPWDGASTNGLPNDSGALRLLNRSGAVLLNVEYGSRDPWPVSPDGAGHSLVLARPSYGEKNWNAWAASDAINGSPGALDPVSEDVFYSLKLNEILAHTDDPVLDFIELYNHSNIPLNISGCVITDDPALDKFVIPTNTVLPARGYLAFDSPKLGFSLSAAGESVLLKNSARTRVVDAVRFGGQENGVSVGRRPNGADQWYRLNAPSPGAANGATRTSQVVITELMYSPLSRNNDHQFVEIFNQGPSALDLSGWRLQDGVAFTFPSNSILPANGCLVVAKNVTELKALYSNLTAQNCLGNYAGALSGQGERVELAMPDTIVTTNATGRAVTNTIYIAIDEVRYDSGGRWGRWADGGGSSLELRDTRSNRRLAQNWADSLESPKAPWTAIEHRGRLDNGNVAPDQLQVLLLGAGECLIDDVQVLTEQGVNLVTNSSFEVNANSWTAEGTLSQSGLETAEGFNSAQSYRIRAVDRGDNQVNRIRVPLAAVPANGSVLTIKARVRWLTGHPEILLRIRGNWLEAAGTMTVPPGGTPAGINSRAQANTGPAIYNVLHYPALPAASESLTITAQAQDPDGLASLTLYYRQDPLVNYSAVTMRDDGLAGDAVAGDGVYSGTVPGASSGSLVCYYIQATDASTSAVTSRSPEGAPARENLVRFGEQMPTGNFPVYRLWMTQSAFNNWSNRRKLDNTPNSVAFVIGNNRVIQNAQAQFAGSPYIAPSFNTPAGNRCGYSISLPADDRFLGGRDLVLDWPGGHGGETTAIQEQVAYWLADRMDLPFSYRHFIRLFVNGVSDMQREGVFEAILQPAGDFLDQWSFGDSDGEFFKIDRAFEFSDGASIAADPMPRLELYTTVDPATGNTVEKTERYRWTWLKRSYQNAHDYSSLFNLVDALNADSSNYESSVGGLVDVEQWMGTFAFEHIINNFDSWGHLIGKNMYAYRSQRGWQIYPFDLDWLMLVSVQFSQQFANGNGPLFMCDDPTVSRLYDTPAFRRMYYRAVKAVVDGPLSTAEADLVMDAKYASLLENGISHCDGYLLTSPAQLKVWFQQRRAVLANELSRLSATFAVTSPIYSSISTNLATMSGTAPIGVESILVNGVAWPVTWTSVTNWTVRFPVSTGTTYVSISGRDRYGALTPGPTQVYTVNCVGQVAAAEGTVVINEIEASPAREDAEFIELYNRSSTTTLDLSGWRLNGLGYTFPPGTSLKPNGFLVLCKNRDALASVYGPAANIFDEYAGSLQDDGETITLYRPSASGAGEVPVTRVRYERAAPWPKADGTARSLQLVDATVDNWRVANWAVVDPVARAVPQWVFFSTNITATSSRLYVYLASVGEIFLDDISISRNGQEFVANGGFESELTGSWLLSPNFMLTTVDGLIRRNGNGSLRLVATAAGTGASNAIFQDLSPALAIGQTYTLSFWYLQTTSGGPLVLRLSGSANSAVVMPEPPFMTGWPIATPGTTNSTWAWMAPFPTLWINELQTVNATGVTNRAGQHTPWIELVNGGSNTVSLAGLYLSPDTTNLTRWAFPKGSALSAGQMKVVFADALTNLTSDTEWHTDFTISSSGGTLLLSRTAPNGHVQVIDYVHYPALNADRSYGSFPDAQQFDQRVLHFSTPGSTNNGTTPAIQVFINEWLADNVAVLADPADGHYEDWFELYNDGDAPVDLGGYFLTDSLTNRFQFEIPATGKYVIPAGGFLLVWADGEQSQNSTNRADLHTNFRLAKEGEFISLFGADGRLVDSIAFGAQTSNKTEGRSPEGSVNVYQLPIATPKAKNPLVNTPPVIEPITTRLVYLGRTLSFFVVANDAESGSQTITYSLDANNAPGGMIHPTSGLFTWTPSAAQNPGEYTITVRATDNGSPALSAYTTFTVRTLLPPEVRCDTGSGTFQLQWQSHSGQLYRIQYKDEVSATAWANLGSDFAGTGRLLSVQIEAGSELARFYRVVVLY